MGILRSKCHDPGTIDLYIERELRQAHGVKIIHRGCIHANDPHLWAMWVSIAMYTGGTPMQALRR